MIEGTRQIKDKQTHPRINLLERMGLYGTAVSAVSGCAFGLVFIFGQPHTQEAPFHVVMARFALGSFLGALVGLLYGLLMAHFIGLAMALTAALFFPDGRRPRLLKITFGALTAVLIYLVSPFHIVRDAFEAILEGSSYNLQANLSAIAIYIIAIYLSQIVARKYLREISARKRKGKPA